MNNETPYKVGTEKDMEVGALNPKVKKLMEEAENKSDQLDIQIVLLSRLCDLKEDQLEADTEQYGKWQEEKCRDNRKGRVNFLLSLFAIMIALLAFTNELSLLDVRTVLISMMEWAKGY